MRYFVFAVRFLVLPWGILFLPWGFWFCCDSCGPPYKVGPLQLAIHVVQNSHAGDAKVAQQDICTTWMSRLVNKWCHEKYAQMRKIAHYVYSADEGVVRPRGSILWYYLFVHNCSASYLTKCSEPKEFYLLLHFCVFLVLFRLLAHVRATRTWTTHFSHLVTVREITQRTRLAPIMLVFLLEKE